MLLLYVASTLPPLSLDYYDFNQVDWLIGGHTIHGNETQRKTSMVPSRGTIAVEEYGTTPSRCSEADNRARAITFSIRCIRMREMAVGHHTI
mmetsp:Transcript_9007/g.18639  ORF Transcript_9007/g.18639 Transcript_9007/m.18639 type:complete len:92 (-) Transcript_9007:157-432(-)